MSDYNEAGSEQPQQDELQPEPAAEDTGENLQDEGTGKDDADLDEDPDEDTDS